MKILLTGATGFVGSHLARKFLQSGHEVVILKRRSSNARRILDIQSQLVAYDIDHHALEDVFIEQGHFDAIVHAATTYGKYHEKCADVLFSNTYFPLRLLELAIEFKTNKFVNTDTYFNTIGGLYSFLSEYVLSKRQFIEWGNYMASHFEINFLNVRLEHVYGPLDSNEKFVAHIVGSLMDNVEKINLTQGEQKRDFVYIDDVVAAFDCLIQSDSEKKDRFQHYEVGTGQSVSIRNFVETAKQLTRAQTQLHFGAIPYRQGEIMDSSADIDALCKLGWSARIGFAEGLQRLIDFEKGCS